MRVLLLSDHRSVHTRKWAISLANSGFEIMIFSLSYDVKNDYSLIPNIRLEHSKYDLNIVGTDSLLKKSIYLFSFFRLRKLIKEFKPEIVHAHYATSYGFLGALTNHHPFILSVWGSDVYDFPSNWFKKSILKFNLKRADRILSTSRVMAIETKKYTSKYIEVTPFGVDTQVFKPMNVESIFSENAIVIGTIKSLEDKYGIDYLIRAFKLLKDKNSSFYDLNLLIVGAGSKERELKKLVRKLNLNTSTIFTGKIDHSEVPKYLNMLDIYVAVSVLKSESFGVAILEASSCELPVVVSNVGGLPEVVGDQTTGIVVSAKNENETFKALDELVNNQTRRIQLGKSGRKRVLENYEWDDCLKQLIDIYTQVRYSK